MIQKHNLFFSTGTSVTLFPKKIAATTQVAEAALITTDKDFSHLDNMFFSVNFIDNLLV
ncbi:MAG: hypothetical protein MUE81_22340 [Thermoflexibacter sp.]|jgi:hypothetical protein|nr:hypothetical protein [Thermoflexibacter sp.]